MPLEIRQIGIRMRVADTPAPARDDMPRPGGVADEERARIVQDCTRAVLAALARTARR